MRSVGTRTPEAERAAGDPPASLLAFGLTEIPPDAGPESLLWADFDVFCKACHHDTFNVGSFPLVAPNPSPYFGILPGKIIERPPHRLRCAACRAVGMIFDPRTDGYDGLLNGGCAYEIGENGEVFTGEAYRIAVSVAYNTELSELEELALELEAAKATDLFDWLTVVATPVGGGAPKELDYECA